MYGGRFSRQRSPDVSARAALTIIYLVCHHNSKYKTIRLIRYVRTLIIRLHISYAIKVYYSTIVIKYISYSLILEGERHVEEVMGLVS